MESGTKSVLCDPAGKNKSEGSCVPQETHTNFLGSGGWVPKKNALAEESNEASLSLPSIREVKIMR